MQTALVGLDEIKDAQRLLEGVSVRTPLDMSRSLSSVVDGEVLIKCENLQRTGSFKIRGAFNRIARLSDEEKAAGVVAASAGNHAQGVALAATLSETRARVFMPEAASLPKVEATKRYGAEVVLTGVDFGAAFDAATEYARETGAVFVHPFDHPHVIAGQGTIGLEIVEQAETFKTLVVPIGGGGLISGIAAAIKALRPETRILGVQASGAFSFAKSLSEGVPVPLETMSTIADGIAANSPGENTLAHVASLVDEVVAVDDEAIAEALVFAAERMKLVLEPAGAAGLAAVLQGAGAIDPPAVVVLSGGNIDPLLLQRLIRFGLSAAGRYFSFHTRLPDRPGELHKLIGLVAKLGANVVGVEHRREGVYVELGEVDVALQLETRGPEHIEDIVRELSDAGYVTARL